MKVSVEWIKDVSFIGRSEHGHSVVIDGPPILGGRNLGVRPMEMLLLGLGSCSSVDVINILKKQRQQVNNCSVEITGTRLDTIPQVFQTINLHFTLSGNNVTLTKIEKAIKTSTTKYCSAYVMLSKVATITHSFSYVESSSN